MRAGTEQGLYLASKAPYGYKKDPDKKYHLIIGEEPVPTVRRIFKLAKEGLGISQIPKTLRKDEAYIYDWTKVAIREILRNPVYTGAIVGYKKQRLDIIRKKCYYCSKRLVSY